MKIIIAILIGCITGLLGAYGGAENTSKGWRRVGIPLLLTIIALLMLKNWWVLTIMSLAGVLSLGYGMPCPLDAVPSKLGLFWSKVFKNPKRAEIAVRATIGLLQGLSVIIIPILKGNWYGYFVASLWIIVVNIFLGGNAFIKDEGTFNFLGKELLVEEYVIYFWLGLIVSLLL